MKYGIFGEDGRIIQSGDDFTLDSLPIGAKELTDEQWGRKFDLLLVKGNVTVSPPIITIDFADSFTLAVKRRLDAFARTRGYDGILSACTYATSPNPKFRAEGQYCVELRDATWDAAYAIMADASFASVEAALALLPATEWPQ